MHLPYNSSNAIHESRGENTASSRGTVPVANASANTKGTWTNLGAATSFAYEGITIYAFSNTAAADYMIDIGVSDGTNRYVLVADLHFAAAKQAEEHNLAMFVPVHVADGAQLSVRVACSTGGSDCDVIVVGHSSNPGGFPGYSRAVALFTPASSRGIAVDPGGTSNTKGSWAELTSSCPSDIDAIFGVVGFNGDTGRGLTVSMLMDIGIGAASNEFTVVPNLSLCWGATWDGPNDVFFQPLAASIPTGTRIAARAQSSDNTAGDRSADLSLYGLVA